MPTTAGRVPANGKIPLTSGLQLWLRSDLGITIGTGVSAWADQSGNGNNVVQATGSKQPTYSASDAAFNGQASLLFAIANLQTLGNAGWNLPQPMTMYAVGSIGVPTGLQAFIDSSAASEVFLGQTSASQHWYLYAGGNIIGGKTNDAFPHAFCGVVNGASSALYVDDSQVADGSGASGANASQVLAIGGTTGTYLGGKIAEIIIYNVAHTAAQRETTFTYLSQRYGLSVN
jgi:hypothetical protein